MPRRSHRNSVPAPSPRATVQPPCADAAPADHPSRRPDNYAVPALTEILTRVAPGGTDIWVGRFDGDDGTPIIYIDAADIVVFIYTQPTQDANGPTDHNARPFTPPPKSPPGHVTDGHAHDVAGGVAGPVAGPVVIDLHRRTETGQHRLRVLLDGAPARLLTIDPAQFHARTSTGSGGLELACARCRNRLDTGTAGPSNPAGLNGLLEAAAAHTCPAPAATQEERWR